MWKSFLFYEYRSKAKTETVKLFYSIEEDVDLAGINTSKHLRIEKLSSIMVLLKGWSERREFGLMRGKESIQRK